MTSYTEEVDRSDFRYCRKGEMVSLSLRARTLVGSMLMICLFVTASRGQTNATASRTFSLEDAVNYALQNYPAVRASLEQLNAARAGVSLARSQYLPFLSGVYQESRATQNQVPGIWLPTAMTPTVEGPIGGSSSGQSYWGSQAMALFSWEPVDFGLRSSNVALAKSIEDGSNADLALTRLQVETAVGNFFLTVVAAEQAVLAAQANVNRWQTFDRVVHTLADNNLRPGADASRADSQLAMARTQLYQAEQTEQVAVATLASLIGAAGIPIQVDSSKLLDQPPVSTLSTAAPATNPVAREQMALVRQIQAQEKVLNRTDYPRLFLQAEGFGRGSEVPNNGSIIGNANGLLAGRGDWVAGVKVTLPNIFDFKALSAQKQMAKANENSQAALYDKTIQDLTGQIQAALAQLNGARLVAQQTPIELEAAQATETQSRARYQANLTTIVEVADAEGLLAQAQMDDSVAHLNVWRGLFNLAYAQGDLQPFLNVLRGLTSN
jgi:outer membrane protein